MGSIRQTIQFWATRPIPNGVPEFSLERTPFVTVCSTEEGLLCTNLNLGNPVYFDLTFGSEISFSRFALPLYSIEPDDLLVLQVAFPLSDWDEEE